MLKKYGRGDGPQPSSKMKNCMIEEDFINTIDSKDDESDANNTKEEGVE